MSRDFDSSWDRSTSGSRGSSHSHVPPCSQTDRQHVVFSSAANSSDKTNSRDESSASAGSMQPCSLSELLEDAETVPPMGPEHQRLLRRLRDHFKDVPDEVLPEMLPKNEFGHAASVGSLLHALDKCRPCRDMRLPQVCSKGLRCGFCHLSHDSVLAGMLDSETGVAANAGSMSCPAPRLRKCQRDRYRRFVNTLEEQIRHDPFGWSLERAAFPNSMFDGRPELKDKLMLRLSSIIERSRNGALRDGTNASGTASSSTNVGGYPAGPSAREAVQSATNVGGCPAGPSAGEAAPIKRRERKLVRL